MNEISFNPELVKKLRVSSATASEAVAEAAMSAVAQCRKITVRTFADALRACAPMLGTSNTVLAAAVKAAKEKGATLNDVADAMASAADKKRRDDARRAAKKRDGAPQKALEKAQAEVQACLLALRTPLQVAQDALDAAEAAVEAAAAALDDAVKRASEARAALDALMKAEAEQGNGEAK